MHRFYLINAREMFNTIVCEIVTTIIDFGEFNLIMGLAFADVYSSSLMITGAHLRFTIYNFFMNYSFLLLRLGLSYLF